MRCPWRAVTLHIIHAQQKIRESQSMKDNKPGWSMDRTSHQQPRTWSTASRSFTFVLHTRWEKHGRKTFCSSENNWSTVSSVLNNSTADSFTCWIQPVCSLSPPSSIQYTLKRYYINRNHSNSLTCQNSSIRWVSCTEIPHYDCFLTSCTPFELSNMLNVYGKWDLAKAGNKFW